MKDPYIVLSQKEQELKRVRREVRALLTVIPLLEDAQPSSHDLIDEVQRLTSSAMGSGSLEDRMRDLETYYPFIRHLRRPESK